jgi:Domain of unknown function (DUF4142)
MAPMARPYRFDRSGRRGPRAAGDNPRVRLASVFAFATLVWGVPVACADGAIPAQAMASGPSDSGADASRAPPCVSSDAIVAAILAAESQAHLDMAFAVRDRPMSPDTTAFAEKVITDRSLALIQLRGEARAAGITAHEGAYSEAIAAAARLAVAGLGSTGGADLDRVFVADEALALDGEVGVIDARVRPAVRDARLAGVATRTREMAASYATLAALVLASLDGPSDEAACDASAGSP